MNENSPHLKREFAQKMKCFTMNAQKEWETFSVQKYYNYITFGAMCDSLNLQFNFQKSVDFYSNFSCTKNKSASVFQDIVLLGDGAVGKSSLLVRFLSGTFSNEYVPTMVDSFQ